MREPKNPHRAWPYPEPEPTKEEIARLKKLAEAERYFRNPKNKLTLVRRTT